MTPEAVAIEVEEGVALRGERWPGGSTTVMLVHAPGEDRDLDDWRPLIPFLLGIGATVLAIDLRGHGASDGEPALTLDSGDLATVMNAERASGAVTLVGCAAGESGVSLLRAAEEIRFEGAILFSPVSSEAPPRGNGVAKLLLGGGLDADSLAAMKQLRDASIGPAISVSLPSAASGVDLVDSEAGLTCREHILRFINECRCMTASAGRAATPPQDLFLELLGIRAKGVER